MLEKHKEESGQHVAWVPIAWACRIVHRARREGRITTDLGQKSLVDEMLYLRRLCGRLLGYNSHNIPLVYAQVSNPCNDLWFKPVPRHPTGLGMRRFRLEPC